MAAGGAGADSARGWLERARDGAKEVEGEVVRLGAWGIEARRRGVAGIGTSGSSARAQLLPVDSMGARTASLGNTVA